MKKIDYIDFIIFMTLTLIIGGMVVLVDQSNKELNKANKNMENHIEYTKALEREIDSLEADKINMLNDIEVLKVRISEQDSTIETLNKEVNKLKSTVNSKSARSTAIAPSGDLLTFEATAYSGDPITATGTVPKVGRTIAVDPKVIPYGSQVYIEGMGTFIAEDCGGAIKGNIIDIFMGSKEECRAWGRRKVQLKIL